MVKIGVKLAIGLVVSTLILASNLAGEVYAITNGVPDEYEHPYVGLIAFFAEVDGGLEAAWFCTGSMISPNVMVCAGHCTEGMVAAGIYLDPGPLNPTMPFEYWSTEIYTHEDYESYVSPTMKDWTSHDVGVVILPGEGAGLPEYAELPDRHMIDELPNKQYVDLVGYGYQIQMRGGGQPVWVGEGTRMNASAQLINNKNAMSDEFVRITHNPGRGKGGISFGDSGGPALLEGTNTMIALCSWGTNINCAGVGYHMRLDLPDILEWIENYLQ